MADILITGAAGFIGHHLVPALKARHTVHALALELPSPAEMEGAHWIVCDLAAPLHHARLPEHVDAVIHLAQSLFYRQFPAQAGDIFAINIQSTFNLLEYARQAGAQHFIFASSGSVYDYSTEKLTEEAPVNPVGFYPTSKYAAELLVRSYETFFHSATLRFFSVYGRGQQGMLVPNLLQRVQRGEQITIEGNPGLCLSLTHVQDAVRVFEPLLALSRSVLLNVAGDEAVTLTELVKQMELVTGRPAHVTHKESPSRGNLVADNTRMKETLGVYPQVSLRQGLEDMLTSEAS